LKKKTKKQYIRSKTQARRNVPRGLIK